MDSGGAIFLPGHLGTSEEVDHSSLSLWNLTVQVQAWWRGCMVRRGLGKFGQKEEPKKGKKKKKQGKK